MITPEQRLARRNHIGSSDIAALAGCDPWKSRLAVFLEKVYDVEDIPRKGPIARGNRYERALLDFAQEELGVELQRDVHVQHPEIDHIAVNLDARVIGRREGVEAKTANISAKGADTATFFDEYGDPGTDIVPDRVLCQTHLQMDAADLEVVHVPVLLARFGRLEENMYRVERNEDLILSLREIAEEFWQAYVLPKIPPPTDGPQALDVIKRIHRTSGRVVDIDPALVLDWRQKNAARLAAEKEEKAAQSVVLASLGDAEIGDYGDPEKWLTYFEQQRAGYVVEPSKYRVTRLSKRF